MLKKQTSQALENIYIVAGRAYDNPSSMTDLIGQMLIFKV